MRLRATLPVVVFVGSVSVIGILAGCGGSQDTDSTAGGAGGSSSQSASNSSPSGTTTAGSTAGATAGASTAGASTAGGDSGAPPGPPATDGSTAGAMAGADQAATTKSPPVIFGQEAGLKISAVVSPYPPVWTSPDTLTLHIEDKAGHPVTGAKFQTTLNMTNMDMGETQPTFQDKGNGDYVTQPKFGMRGPWRLKLTVTVPGHKPVTHNLDYNVQ